MSPSPAELCSEDLYTRLTTILRAVITSPPVVHEIAILPSSSHPTVQYDPNSEPPAVGIPKAVLLSCFLHARSVFFSHLEAIGENPVSDREPNASAEKQRMEISNATAVMLLWEPNHLTATSWRKRAFADGKAQGAELSFLTSLLTSPMPQHAKSSTLWSYRLQILRRSHNRDSKCREELDVVMLAGERHAKNYHAWEYARQVWRLFFNGDRSNVSERDNDWSQEQISLFQDSVSAVHKWCLRHPTDISGWAFLAFLLRSPPNEAMRQQEATKIVGQTTKFVEKVAWVGDSVTWFLKTAPEISA